MALLSNCLKVRVMNHFLSIATYIDMLFKQFAFFQEALCRQGKSLLRERSDELEVEMPQELLRMTLFNCRYKLGCLCMKKAKVMLMKRRESLVDQIVYVNNTRRGLILW